MHDDGRFDALAGQLEGVAEALGDLALDQLRRAADPDGADADGALAFERRLTRARRAVEKAVALLRGPGDDLG